MFLICILVSLPFLSAVVTWHLLTNRFDRILQDQDARRELELYALKEEIRLRISKAIRDNDRLDSEVDAALRLKGLIKGVRETSVKPPEEKSSQLNSAQGRMSPSVMDEPTSSPPEEDLSTVQPIVFSTADEE